MVRRTKAVKSKTATRKAKRGTVSPKQHQVGRSVNGEPIRAWTYDFGAPQSVLILAAMHGDEPKTVYVAERFQEVLAGLLADPETDHTAFHNVVLNPVVNPDGYARRWRVNANGVDLNRNWPTRDWALGKRRSRYFGGESAASEPETRALKKLIDEVRPLHIITLHSISKHRQCNNYNGAAKRLAARLEKCNGYPATPDIGYSTPGSFGTWAGVEQNIPTITLELPSHTSKQQDWKDNEAALLAAIRR